MSTKNSDALPLYRRVIRDAWHIAWHHKHLWIFGFFATFIGFGGASDLFLGGYDKMSEIAPAAAWRGSALWLIPGMGTMKSLLVFSSYPFLALIIFLSVCAVFAAVFAWIITVSVGALVGSVKKIERGGDADFVGSLKFGAANFWRLFGINLTVKVLGFLALLITGANLFAAINDRSPVSVLMYVGSFIVYLIVAVTIAIVGVYASIWTTLKGTGVMESLRHGWVTFAANWLVSVENAVLLMVIGTLAGLAALAGLLIVSVPFFFLALLAIAIKSQALAAVTVAAGAIVFVVALVLAASFVTTFQVASWTVLWTELTEGKPVAKLIRLTRQLGWK